MVDGLGMVDGPGANGSGPSLRQFILAAARRPGALLRALDLRGWSERTVIALVMQAHDNSLTISGQRGFFGRTRLVSRPGHGQPNPTWLPVGHEVVRRLARAVGGNPGGTWGEIFGMPMTAHFLGGCVIGASAGEGVIDGFHRVYSCPGLYVADGSAMPANPGANPALTITAMAERAFSYWPNKGDPDPRPPLDSEGRNSAGPSSAGPSSAGPSSAGPSSAGPSSAGHSGGRTTAVPIVAPKWPVVPVGAGGELRLG
jgi:cholesterol oxidase